MTSCPLGSSCPAIQRLRAVTGSDGARNQVHAAPQSSARNGCRIVPDVITMLAPDASAMRPASILVTMPPRDSSDPALPAIASMSGVICRTSRTSVPAGVLPGGAVYRPSMSDSSTRQSALIMLATRADSRSLSP